MADYRLYFHGADGHFMGMESFASEDDEGAIAIAESKAAGRAMELWERGRKVRDFAAEAIERRG